MRCGSGVVLMLGMVVLACSSTPVTGAPPTAEQIENMKSAMPEKAVAKPQVARKLLVFTLCKGFRHSSIECGAKALELLGRQTGAYEVVVSDDVAMFAANKLRQFDAVCFLNTTGELFDDPELKQHFLDYVKSGKGVVGIHAATDCFYEWPAFGELMGGYFNGHPWHEQVTIKLDEPDHPINAAFGGQAFEIVDEIYQFREPYSRQRLRVLLSLDTEKTDMNKTGIRRTDGDFAVSWVRRYGQGRVFYCSLGHREETYWNSTVLEHYLAGIQYALGDLEADATLIHGRDAHATQSHGRDARPTQLEETGWTPLFNGKDLTGWKGLVGNPVTRAKMTPGQLAEVQAKADEDMRAHWKVVDGVLVFDGKGHSICTAKDFGDFEMLVDWKIEPGGDSGVYLRGSPQVQIWDPTQWPEGSGGLYNNQKNPSKPHRRADNPVGQWNTFRIKMIGERVTVHLNDVLVADDVVLENYWERDKPIYPSGHIELQSHGSKLRFKNIKIREVLPDEAARVHAAPVWRSLLRQGDLTGWRCKPGAWNVADGVLTRKGGGDIWSGQQFGDFILELEFKLAPQTNSGVFFRTANTADCVQTGIEMQVLDSYGKEPDKHQCGAIYDCRAPRKITVRKPGKWNHAVLTCRGSQINVVMNGEEIVDMDLDEWTEPHKNPDGTKNKFRTAYRNMPRVGHIGFQDHGKPIWYRNIRIKELAATP